jgi:hypothetical protein
MRGMRELAEQIQLFTGLRFGDYQRVLRDTHELGLVGVKRTFAGDSTILDDIAESRDLLVVMNDGRSWVSSNREVLAHRIADPGKTTRIVLLHPKSDFLGVLTRKNGKTLAQQVEDARRSFEALQADATRPGALEIRGHYGFNPFTLILTAKHAFISPYFYNERGALPLFTFTSSARLGLYADLRQDAVRLFESATTLTAADFG